MNITLKKIKNKKIFCIFKSGRNSRYDLINKGLAPREFFYGMYDLEKKGYNILRLTSEFETNKISLKISRIKEILFNYFHKLGLGPSTLKFYLSKFESSNIIISFTDGLSLTLGYYSNFFKNKDLYLIGCFHCLSDYENRLPKFLRFWSRMIIKRSIKNLDHLAFFGPADRDYVLDNYKLSKNKTSLIKFGVDTDFWKPSRKLSEKFIFSIGQDPNRDFETLMNAKVNYPIKIHTSLKLKIPDNNNQIFITKGSFYNSTLSDIELKKIYQKALIVVVPLKDVFQPTGYSVTLQAMACGKPVILSKIKGLWAPKILKHNFNCVLVPPGDADSLQKCINELVSNKNRYSYISKNARKTVLEHFNISKANFSVEQIIKKGLIS